MSGAIIVQAWRDFLGDGDRSKNVGAIRSDSVGFDRPERQENGANFSRNPFAELHPVDALHLSRAW
jgi:hypothetical protein